MTLERLDDRLNWVRRRLAEIDTARDVTDPATARLLHAIRMELESLCCELNGVRND